MVRDSRVKQYIFNSFSVNGSTISEIYSNFPLNGQIDKITFTGITSPGSLWLAESGTGIEIFRKNDFTSGTSTAFESYPFVYAVNSINTTGSPQTFVNRVTNNVLSIAGSGFTSGTGTTFGPCTIFYR